jgi:Kef-type K+ transport system membrane component KefB
MRRAIILVLLLFGMQLVLPLGVRPEGAPSLLTFGFLILAAYTVGEIAKAVRLPKIVGYLGAGVLFGPYVLGVVTTAATIELAPVSELAVALIAFLAGAELKWHEVRERGTTILKLLGAELGISFVCIAGALIALRPFVPFLAESAWVPAIALAALFASVAIVHSPAVTLALLSETGARGPVARTTLGVVLVADVVVVVLFSLVLAVVRQIAPAPGTEAGGSLALLAWEIGGSVLVGALLGMAVALYLRAGARQLVLVAVMIALLGSEVARLTHVETLLTLLVAGFVTENFSRDEGEKLRHAMERSAAPIFVVFFALAGAKIAVRELIVLLPIVVPIVLARAGGIWAGVRLGARWARTEGLVRDQTWKGLISQAGVAIGLSAVIASAYPGRGEQMRALFLAVIAINETLGPVLFRQALARSGELRGEADLSELTDADRSEGPPVPRPAAT